MRNNGYTEENDSLCVYDATGAGHNEWYWQQRVDKPLKFLLSGEGIENTGTDDVIYHTAPVNEIYNISGITYPSTCYDRLPAGIYIMAGKQIIKK